MKWYLRVLKKYAVFKGRARRMEFWMFMLFNFIIYLALNLMGVFTGIPLESQTSLAVADIFGIYSLAILLPSLAVGVRRLHDIGKRGWWLLLLLIPIIGLLILFDLARDSQPGENQYGPNPKTAAA